MIILGIDPGYAILGYGAVEAERGKIRVIDYGVVETTPKMTFPERLERLYAGTKLLTMVKLLLKLQKIPKPDDAADALGAALCHANALGPMVEQFRIK